MASGRVLIADNKVGHVLRSEPRMGDYPAAMAAPETLDKHAGIALEEALHVGLLLSLLGRPPKSSDMLRRYVVPPDEGVA